MRKRWWIAILTGLCACFASVGLMACGGVGESSENSESSEADLEERGYCKMELSRDESYYIVTGLESEDCKELIIPSEYKGKPVKEIGNYAFYSCDSLTEIIFEDTSTWYRTVSSANWENKTGGTETDVTDSAANATYLTSEYAYYSYYLYKL